MSSTSPISPSNIPWETIHSSIKIAGGTVMIAGALALNAIPVIWLKDISLAGGKLHAKMITFSILFSNLINGKVYGIPITTKCWQFARYCCPVVTCLFFAALAIEKTCLKR